MEDRDLAAVVNAPNTPESDRPISQNGIGGKCVSNIDEKSITDLAWRNLALAENGNSRRLVTCHKICDNDVLTGSTHTGDAPLKKMCAQNKAPFFRRTSAEQSFERIHSNAAEKTGKGIVICSNSPLKMSGTGKDAVLDLTENKGQSLGVKAAFPPQGSENIPSVGSTRKTPSTWSNSPLCNFNSYASPICDGIGMKNAVKNDGRGPNLIMNHANMVDLCDDSPLKNQLQDSLPCHPLNLQRIARQKRLVRNGCIAPQNVPTKNKGLTKQIGDNASSSAVLGRCAVSRDKHISDIVAEEESPDKLKGKGLLIHPPVANANDSGTVQFRRNSTEYIGERGGWRTTPRHLDNTSQSSQEVIGLPSGSKQYVGCSTSMQQKSRVDRNLTGSQQSSRALCNHLEDTTAQSTSGIISETYGVNESHNVKDILNKRRRKEGTTSKNDVEGQSSASCDPDIILLDKPREPSNPRSSSTRQHLGNLDAEVVALTPEIGETISLRSDSMHTEDLYAKGRQLEADERLALELQEQFYHEALSFEPREMDEYLARSLQHEEEAFHRQSMPDFRLLPNWSNRQPRLQNNQNSSNRRGAQSPGLIRNRMMRSRSRNVSQSRPQRVSSMRSRFRFPSNMDLDMRLDILEALESAADDFDDMGMADDIFQIERDFNENDYEMLLALDENNHRHAGASANQISGLPQSLVQSEAMEESCAICLETPTFGETIRHLPCLHKFHKDCIDPWLLRKTSCPVCKSSIT